MTYLKTIGVGIVAALLFGAAWGWAALQLELIFGGGNPLRAEIHFR